MIFCLSSNYPPLVVVVVAVFVVVVGGGGGASLTDLDIAAGGIARFIQRKKERGCDQRCVFEKCLYLKGICI